MIARRGSIDPGDCALTVSLFLSTSLSHFGIYTRVLPFPVLFSTVFLRGRSISLYFSFARCRSFAPLYRVARRLGSGSCVHPFRLCVGSFLPSFLPFAKGESLLRPGSKSKNPERRDRLLSPSLPFSHPDTRQTVADQFYHCERDQRHFRRPTYPWYACRVATPPWPLPERINPDLLDVGIMNLLLVSSAHPLPFTLPKTMRRGRYDDNDYNDDNDDDDDGTHIRCWNDFDTTRAAYTVRSNRRRAHGRAGNLYPFIARSSAHRGRRNRVPRYRCR